MSIDQLTALSAHASKAGLPIDILAGLTLLSLAPLLLVMTTSFMRIVIVLSLVRSAIGAAALPPNAALTGLALVLTMVIMAPTMQAISHDALDPYSKGKISQPEMLTRAFEPLRTFMLRQTHEKDIALFARIAHAPQTPANKVAPTVLIPAFAVGELRSAFAIGFALYLPFVAIDLAVASILMGLGMFMLSPPIISLPCKLLLFVMVDGWALICGGLAQSFR